MSKKINLFLLILAGSLPLVNGGKGFGAFCFTTILLCGLGFWVIYKLRQSERITIQAYSYFNTLVYCFYVLILLNLFFTVYLYATVIEWIRITGYLIFYLLLSLSASIDRKAFASLSRNMLFLVMILSLVEAVVIMIQNYIILPPRGTMPNENVAASYILIGLMVVLSYILFNPGVSRRIKTIGIIPVVVLSVALFLSHSRGILIALIITIGVLSKLKFKKWGLILPCLIVLGIVALVPMHFFDTIFKINVPNSYRRLYIWQSAWEIIKQRPWFGWGMGNFGLPFPHYNLPSFDTILRFGKVTRFAHNEFLQVAAEMGLPALALYCALIGYVFKAGHELILKKNIDWVHAAAYVSFTGILVHSLVDFNLHLPAITFMSVMTGAILLLDDGVSYKQSCKFPMPAKKTAVFLLSSILVLIMLFFLGHVFLGKAEKGEIRQEPANTIISAYKKAQFFNPLNSYHHEKLAKLYAGQYQQEKNVFAGELAVAEYTKASRLNPEEASFYEDLFYLYYTLGSPLPKMEENYVLVMAHNPHLVKPTLVLAVFHMQRRSYGRAMQLLSEVIEKEPNYLAAYYYLGLSNEFLGDRKGARDNYEIIVQKLEQHLERLAQSNYELQALQVPQADVFTRLGIIYNQDRRYAQSIALLKKTLALDPGQVDAINTLAGTYFALGQFRSALPYAREAVRLDPKNKEFRRNLDLCLQKISPPRKP